jgi:hypothetical protein
VPLKCVGILLTSNWEKEKSFKKEVLEGAVLKELSTA